MRLTTKGRFAVTAMIDLALRQNNGPVTLAAISQRQQISLSYLEQLFGKLRRHELTPTAPMVDVLLQSGDALRAQLARHQGAGGDAPGNEQDQLAVRCERRRHAGRLARARRRHDHGRAAAANDLDDGVEVGIDGELGDQPPCCCSVFFSIFAQVSRSVVVRLNTILPGVESTESMQK